MVIYHEFAYYFDSGQYLGKAAYNLVISAFILSLNLKIWFG
jgi:hypothetical protein